MKNIFYLGSVMCLMALSFMGCTKEETFRIPASSVKNVNFNVINLSVGDIDNAQSVGYKGYFDEEYSEQEKKFTIDYYRTNDWYNPLYPQQVTIVLNSLNMLWAAGMNELEITFTPSCPEEKEATFTMPDGKVYTVTADNPTFTWELTPDAKMTDISSWHKRMIIKAESKYQRQDNTVLGQGYVLISLDNDATDIQYNKGNNTWYLNDWMRNPEITVRDNVNFNAANLTVGEPDSAASVLYNNSYGDYDYPSEPRDEKFTIYYYAEDYDGNFQQEEKTVYLTQSNSLWAAGMNEIEFTFVPSCPEEKEATFYMPDGKEYKVTADNPTFNWMITPEVANKADYAHYRIMAVKAKSSYRKQGISVEACGFVFISLADMGTELQYNKANNTWYYNDWTR